MLIEIRTAVIHPRHQYAPEAHVVRVYSCCEVAYSLQSERELTKATIEAYCDSGDGDHAQPKVLSEIATMKIEELLKIREEWNIETEYKQQDVITTATEV
jgi:hypothetical protein